jgi:hypothetical protein
VAKGPASTTGAAGDTGRHISRGPTGSPEASWEGFSGTSTKLNLCVEADVAFPSTLFRDKCVDSLSHAHH